MTKIKTLYRATISLSQDAVFCFDQDSAMAIAYKIFGLPYSTLGTQSAYESIDDIDNDCLWLSFRSALMVDDIIANAEEILLWSWGSDKIDKIVIDYQNAYDIEPGRVVLRFNEEPEFYVGEINWKEEKMKEDK